MRQILLPLALAAATQAQLVTFSAGSPAKAADVNGNFAYLAARLDSLTKAQASRLDSLAKALASKDTVIASLKGLVGLGDSLTKFGKRLDAGIPKGTIAGFMTAPGIDGYLPNSDQTWILAAGQKGVVGFDDLPELRGVFLRGMELDFNVAGSSASYNKRDVQRVVGAYQDDAFQGHWHRAMVRTINDATDSPSCKGQQNDRPVFNTTMIQDAVTDTVNGIPRTAKETRPKNVAVYWYIKVK